MLAPLQCPRGQRGNQSLGVLVGVVIGLLPLGERSARQASYQRIFWGCLSLAGLATFVSMLVGPGTGLASGATLALMVLTATWDFGRAVM